MKFKVEDLNTVREKATSDSLKNAVGKVQKRVTYVDIILRGNKRRE